MTTPIAVEHNDVTARVAEEIRALMGRRKVTGAQMAKALGVSAAWVSYRINGSVSPSVNDMDRIAAVLGVTVVDLFPRRDREATVTSRQPSTSIHAPVNIRPHDGRPGSRPRGGRPPNSPNRTSRLSRAA